MTAFDGEFLRERFPKINEVCLQFGLNIAGLLFDALEAAV